MHSRLLDGIDGTRYVGAPTGSPNGSWVSWSSASRSAAGHPRRWSKSSIYRWTSGDDPQLGFFRLGENGDIRVAGAHLLTFLREHWNAVDQEQDELIAGGFDFDRNDDE